MKYILTTENSDNSVITKFQFIVKVTSNTALCLLLIGIVGFLLRLYYMPQDIPIILDGSLYFWYAIDMSIVGHFPSGYNFPNNGWPAFLSLFFSLMKSQNFMDYMELQRFLTITISTFTIIPIYLLGTRLLEKQYALLASLFFLFDPRLIINSLLGLTDTSFILLGTLSLFFILTNRIRISYFAFATTALFALVRYEGLLLIVPLSIMFFIRFRREHHVVFKFLLGICVFTLILTPMAYERYQITGQDGLVSHIAAGVRAHQYISEYPESGPDYYVKTLQQAIGYLVQYVGWVMIPNFVFFVPLGIVLFVKLNLKKIKDPRIITLVLFVFTMLIPAAYAYSRGYQEPRYLHILFPVFCLISAYTVKEVLKRTKKFTVILLISIIVGVLMGSLFYVESKGLDNLQQKESYLTAIKISKLAKGVNPYSESEYIKIAYLLNQDFPTLRKNVNESPKLISYDESAQFLNYVIENRENGLTHIVTDGLFASSSEIERTLNDIFVHEENYQYLKKVYDSSIEGFKYKIKVFEINYDAIASS